MGLTWGSGLLARTVVFRDIRLGTTVEVLLSADATRVVALEVRCGDGSHRFLPFGACEAAGGRLEVDSALVLMEGRFYADRGFRLGSLRGAAVRLEGKDVGAVSDVLVGPTGEVAALVLEADGEEREVTREGAELLVADALRPAV